MNLDELEARARAAKEARRAANTYYAAPDSPADPNRMTLVRELQVTQQALDESLNGEARMEDTILHLIERARAGQELVACVGDFPDGLVPDGLLDDAVVEIRTTARGLRRLRAALDRWESLTSTPEEAR